MLLIFSAGRSGAVPFVSDSTRLLVTQGAGNYGRGLAAADAPPAPVLETLCRLSSSSQWLLAAVYRVSYTKSLCTAVTTINFCLSPKRLLGACSRHSKYHARLKTRPPTLDCCCKILPQTFTCVLCVFVCVRCEMLRWSTEAMEGARETCYPSFVRGNIYRIHIHVRTSILYLQYR